MGNISNDSLTSTMKRLKLLKGWLEEKEEYFCIDRFDTFDFMSALTTAIWVIEDEIAKKELDERFKILAILEPGEDDKDIRKVEKEVEKLIGKIYGERAVKLWKIKNKPYNRCIDF